MESKTNLDKERLPFAELLGVKILISEAARVTAEMLVRAAPHAPVARQAASGGRDEPG